MLRDEWPRPVKYTFALQRDLFRVWRRFSSCGQLEKPHVFSACRSKVHPFTAVEADVWLEACQETKNSFSNALSLVSQVNISGW